MHFFSNIMSCCLVHLHLLPEGLEHVTPEKPSLACNKFRIFWQYDAILNHPLNIGKKTNILWVEARTVGHAFEHDFNPHKLFFWQKFSNTRKNKQNSFCFVVPLAQFHCASFAKTASQINISLTHWIKYNKCELTSFRTLEMFVKIPSRCFFFPLVVD